MESNLGRWDPITPAGAADVLSGLQCPWWIAGGWAIDLHVGHQTRDHDDIDVLILREDQLALQRQLAGWDLHAADPPGVLRPWRPGEVLPAAVRDIWCRRTPTSMWCLQLMIDDAKAGVWTYRRDARVRRPVAELHGRRLRCRPTGPRPGGAAVAQEPQAAAEGRGGPARRPSAPGPRPEEMARGGAISGLAWTPVARIPLTTDDVSAGCSSRLVWRQRTKSACG